MWEARTSLRSRCDEPFRKPQGKIPMDEINFVNFAIDAKDKEKLDEVVKTVSEKFKVIPYKREAKFLRNFTLSLMKQYKKPFLVRKAFGEKNNLGEENRKETIKPYVVKKVVKLAVPKIPNELDLDEFMPSPPKEVELEVPLPEIKMPEAPHRPLTGGPIPEEIKDSHIPLAPVLENEPLDAPESTEDIKDLLPSPPKFPN